MSRRSTLPHHHVPRLAAAIFAAAFLCAAAQADETSLMARAPQAIAAPAINLPDIDGNRFSLTDRKGAFTLVNFWALWCAPCREEMPSLARLQSAMADRGLEVITVNLGDKPRAIERFLKRSDSRSLIVLLDEAGETGRAWHVQGLPATFLIGPDGRVTHAALGARDWSAAAARRWFEKTISSTHR